MTKRKYGIRQDGKLNWIVYYNYKSKDSKTGKKVKREGIVGYYSDLGHAANRLADVKLKDLAGGQKGADLLMAIVDFLPTLELQMQKAIKQAIKSQGSGQNSKKQG